MFIVAHNASPVLGGGEIWVARLLAGLQQRGHRVLLLCRNDGIAEKTAEFGIPTGVRVLRGDAVFTDALLFARALRRDRPDALLFTTFKKSWLGGMAARMSGVPRVLLRVGALPNQPGGRTYRIALKNWIDAIVLNSNDMRAPLIDALPMVPPSKFITIYDGILIQTGPGSGGELRAQLGIPSDAQVVGSIGRLVKQKRYDRLLRAVTILPSRVHCIIAGDGSDMDSLQVLARELGIDNRVHLIGFQSDVSGVLDSLAVFVISSDFEGMANAMLEAMAAGIPVVSTRVSGAEEAVGASSEGGLQPGIITGFEPEDISAAIARLLDDDTLRMKLGDEARRRIRVSFSFERMLDQWETLMSTGATDVG
jgi:glycosyltransferase involved in cell wall biosynthesis